MKAGGAAELVVEIERGVARGELEPGQRLPSVRNLAAELGLSPATVAAGLAELRRRGVVVSEQRRGTRIGSRPPIGPQRAPLPVPPGARDLSRGNPDPALLPDPERALRRVRVRAGLYGEPQALPELLELARERLRADEIPCEALCVVSGALDGIERVLGAHLRPGDRVVVENPGYAALFDLLRALGLSLVPAAVDGHGMLPAALAAALDRGAGAVVLTPRGQNPTGAAFDAARAQQLAAVLAEHPSVLTIEDDHLAQIAGTPMHSTLAYRDPSPGRWAATRSVSKALGPDLRLALLAGDPLTLARVEGRQLCGPGWVSRVLQTLVLSLWRDQDVERQVESASATYARRRERLLEALRRRGVSAEGASGLNVWIPVAEEASTVSALLQRGWVTAPGAAYRLEGAEPAVRVTTATLLEDEADRLAGDVATVLAPGAGGRNG
jgi:DNA-binding transcriptional MocR family regulator